MKKSREEIEREMRAKAEEVIARTLEWYDKTEAPTLSEVEAEVVKMRRVLSEEMARILIQGQASVHPESRPYCAKCGGRLEDKGEKRKTVDCLIGQVKIERSYYYCPRCKVGLFPPG
jgi:hypothetical protein